MKRPGMPPISGQLTFQEFLQFGQLTLHHFVGVLRLGKIAAPDIPDILGECLDGLISDVLVVFNDVIAGILLKFFSLSQKP
jgi:hypothetical protein